MQDGTVATEPRTDWSIGEVKALFAMPFNDVLYLAHGVHRSNFPPDEVQVSTLLSIKTGACPEDCAYCPQSARFNAGLEREPLMEPADVIAAARTARDSGATRFCMGAAYRSPSDGQVDRIVEMVEGVSALGLETCATLGMLSAEQAQRLERAGLDYYNHNLDTSERYYSKIITTRRYEDRIETLGHVRDAGMKVCCGGIVGMGESSQDRVELLHALATLPRHPESVPINMLVRVEGTPLFDTEPLDPIEFVRTVAVARILMPLSHVRLSAGRNAMSDEMQALCFFAGANSMFYGERLLTTGNPDEEHDLRLFDRLGVRPEPLDKVEGRRVSVGGAEEGERRPGSGSIRADHR